MPTYVVMVKKNNVVEDTKKIRCSKTKKIKCRKIKLMQPSSWDAELEVRKQLASDEDIMDISLFGQDNPDPPSG